MDFNKHYDLEGQHAFLSASKYHWVNYDDEKIVLAYTKLLAAQKGTELHEFARRCIKLNQRLPKLKLSLNTYVNDAIGYHMTPEQILWYSVNAFGTADSISFRDNKLRIHDLKTGHSPVSMKQLEVYSALFCLEYAKDPSKISIELRIYQSNEILVNSPDHKSIKDIMDKIIRFDRKIESIKAELEA